MDKKLRLAQAFYSRVPDENIETLYHRLEEEEHFDNSTPIVDVAEKALNYGNRVLTPYGRGQIEQYVNELHAEFSEDVDPGTINEIFFDYVLNGQQIKTGFEL